LAWTFTLIFHCVFHSTITYNPDFLSERTGSSFWHGYTTVSSSMQRIQQGKSLASSNQVINTSRNTETESSKLSAVYTEIPSNCSSRYTESSKAKVWPPRRWPASTAGCRIRPPHRQIRLPRHWIRPLGFRICYRRQQEREWGRGCTPPPRAPPLLSPAVAWAIGDPLKRR
jgi:hypothetical protein